MFRTALAGAAMLAAAPSIAQDELPEDPAEVPAEAPTGAGQGPWDFSVGLALMSDHRFRGVSRSDEDPALRATFNLAHDSGLYAGVRATTLKGRDSFRLRDPAFEDLGEAQLDLYAGYGARLGDGFELDAGALYYAFVGGDGATDYVEPYASLSYLIGPVYATAGAKYAPSQRAIGDEDMLYLFGQVDATIPFRPWSFTALVGHQDWGDFGNYWTWSLGVEHHLQIEALPGAHVGLSYVDTDLPSVAGQDAGLVASVRLDF
ncbi:MAG: TorF family putative porin [Allosphingosinicella sp.]